MKELMKREPLPSFDLRDDFGFVGTVSEEALAEIEALERRSALVLTTSHLFRFR